MVVVFAPLVVALAQSTKPPTQPLSLPDPTPREVDPHLVFGQPPVSAVQQQRALQRSRLFHQQLVSTSDEIALLARQLEERVRSSDGSGPGPPSVMAAQQIEKLAKQMKDKLKAQ